MVFKYHLKSTESIRISEDGFMIAMFLEDGHQKVNRANSNDAKVWKVLIVNTLPKTEGSPRGEAGIGRR